MLFFKFNTTPSIYVYNEGLQLMGKKEVPLKLSAAHDRRIIPFKNYYLLYLHQPGSTRHELWKINPDGEPTSLTARFQHFIDTTFKKNTSTLQMINQGEQLVVVANTYYPEVEKVVSSVVQLDDSLQTLSRRKILYPFNREDDVLKQVTLAGDHLFILKYSTDSSQYLLKIIRADLTTGALTEHVISSSSRFDSEPAFMYMPADSSLLVYATVRSKVLVSKLDHYLNEVQPVTLLDAQFSKNVFTNFLLLEGETQKWLAVHRSNTHSYYPTVVDRRNDPRYLYGLNRNLDYSDPFYDPYTRWNYQRAPAVDSAIRFVLYNKKLQPVKDSVARNKNSLATLQVRDYANIMLGAKSHLILKQSFTGRKKGLLLVSLSDDGRLAARDLAVFEHYQYLLSNLEILNNEAVIFPFMDKWEVGLVKISFAKMDR